MPIGRSTGSKRISASTRSMPSEMPTEEMNSETTTSAPWRRQIWRNGDSDTPAMGAKNSGKSCLTEYGKFMRWNVIARCARSNQVLPFARQNAPARVLFRGRDQARAREHHEGRGAQRAGRAAQAR